MITIKNMVSNSEANTEKKDELRKMMESMSINKRNKLNP